ncbi:MAG: hypothetical protein HYZ17_17875 [Betaproteobacteria bacterium]|nr:hypothetical protein [Betaproteobacteria bacterium]
MQFQSPSYTIQAGPRAARIAQCYGVGIAKSGTHSVAELFRPPLRSMHEPEAARTIEFILARAGGRIGDEEAKRYVLARDQRLHLDLEASHFNVYLLRELVALFPAARFVLTLREPRSWLDSIINQQLAHYSEQHWVKLRELRFQPLRFPHGKGEEALRQRGLYSLDGYLRYWTWHQQTVLDTVPPERLLLVPTEEIGARAKAIAAFGEIPERFLGAERAPSYTARKKFGVLEELDPQHLQDALDIHCQAMLTRLFAAQGKSPAG